MVGWKIAAHYFYGQNRRARNSVVLASIFGMGVSAGDAICSLSRKTFALNA
jgi:hypothetical protein